MWQQTKPAVATFAFHNFDFGCHTAASVAATKWNWHNSGTKLIGVFVLHVSHFSFMLIACLCFMLIFFQCTYWMLLYNFCLCLFVCVRTHAIFVLWTFIFSDKNKPPFLINSPILIKITGPCVVTATRKLVNEQHVTWWCFLPKGELLRHLSQGKCQDYCFQCRQMLVLPPYLLDRGSSRDPLLTNIKPIDFWPSSHEPWQDYQPSYH